MNKALSKEIMTRPRLRNKFKKDRSEENKKKYSKQRNYCVSLLRKYKPDYFGNLDEKDINDNATFWKNIKLFLLDKVRLTNKTTLINNEEIIMDYCNTAKFSNIVSNRNIAEYLNCEPLAKNISDPILKCIVKFRNHHSTLALGEVCNKYPRLPFSFSKINREEVLGENLKLETSKACQDTDTATKLIKENGDMGSSIEQKMNNFVSYKIL